MRVLQQATDGRALSSLALDLFREMGLVETLGLHLDKLTQFLEQMERGHILNPYHNAMRTALVLQVHPPSITTFGAACSILNGHKQMCCHLQGAFV